MFMIKYGANFEWKRYVKCTRFQMYGIGDTHGPFYFQKLKGIV